MIMTLSPLLAPALIDPAEFETTILNLVINSRDAMTGGGQITIETKT
jgi:signal transduction histidine kinase